MAARKTLKDLYNALDKVYNILWELNDLRNIKGHSRLEESKSKEELDAGFTMAVSEIWNIVNDLRLEDGETNIKEYNQTLVNIFIKMQAIAAEYTLYKEHSNDLDERYNNLSNSIRDLHKHITEYKINHPKSKLYSVQVASKKAKEKTSKVFDEMIEGL